jgi:hypothetical protein
VTLAAAVRLCESSETVKGNDPDALNESCCETENDVDREMVSV